MASIKVAKFFFGYGNVLKMAKKGGHFFFCAFGAKFFGDSDQALIRTRGGAIVVSSKWRGGTLGQSKNGGGSAF